MRYHGLIIKIVEETSVKSINCAFPWFFNTFSFGKSVFREVLSTILIIRPWKRVRKFYQNLLPKSPPTRPTGGLAGCMNGNMYSACLNSYCLLVTCYRVYKPAFKLKWRPRACTFKIAYPANRPICLGLY
jgi:hypothetical protein